MENANTANNVFPARGRALSDTIAKFRDEFSTMKSELRDAQRQNTALKKELAKWYSQSRAIPQVDLPSLRRHVAYYCHPDRGGDANLMSKLNSLFDFLSVLEASAALGRDQNTEGAVQ